MASILLNPLERSPPQNAAVEIIRLTFSWNIKRMTEVLKQLNWWWTNVARASGYTTFEPKMKAKPSTALGSILCVVETTENPAIDSGETHVNMIAKPSGYQIFFPLRMLYDEREGFWSRSVRKEEVRWAEKSVMAEAVTIFFNTVVTKLLQSCNKVTTTTSQNRNKVTPES